MQPKFFSLLRFVIIFSFFVPIFSVEQVEARNLKIIAEPSPFLFSDDFSLDPNTSNLWSIHRYSNDLANEVSWYPDQENTYLTRAVSMKSTAMFAEYELTTRVWEASFQYKIGSGSGADGIVFMFYKNKDAYGLPCYGGGMGFELVQSGISIPVAGYGIELDTYNNGTEPTINNHLAIIKDSVKNHLAFAESSLLEDNIFHQLDINFNNGHIVVSIDGLAVLGYDIPLMDYSYTGVGIGAATGSFTNNHIIDDFSLLVTPGSFLDLPFSYDDAHSLALRDTWNKGLVNSWFDHQYPLYSPSVDNLFLFTGDILTTHGESILGNQCYLNNAGTQYCYNGHNGYDFIGGEIPILAAGKGDVEFSGEGPYGNQVIIDHQNGYYSLYGHLRDAPLVNPGDQVVQGQQIGVMGDTGLISSGTHLHFGVYQDNDGKLVWEGEHIDKPVDPNGFLGEIDPWVSDMGGPKSIWLWQFDRSALITALGEDGLSITDLNAEITAQIPAGFFEGEVTVELIREPEIAAPSASLKSTGYSFWLHLLDLLDGNQIDLVHEQTSELINLSIIYSDDTLTHLDESGLKLFQWSDETGLWVDLNAGNNFDENMIQGFSSSLGHFSLQAPLLCVADPFIMDDAYYGAFDTSTTSTPYNRVFDIQTDEDWFTFEAIEGWEYVLQTQNLAPGVDTFLSLVDVDGVTTIASNNDHESDLSSELVWMAPKNGIYFVRVSQNSGSVIGCEASYDLSITRVTSSYLPIILN